jgi:hypothetical protein
MMDDEIHSGPEVTSAPGAGRRDDGKLMVFEELIHIHEIVLTSSGPIGGRPMSRLILRLEGGLRETATFDADGKTIFLGSHLFGPQLADCHGMPRSRRAQVAFAHMGELRSCGVGFTPLGLFAIMITCSCHGVFLSINRSCRR